MAQNLAKLLLRIEADTAKARQELNMLERESKDSSGKIGASYSKAGVELDKMGRGIARLAAVAGVSVTAGGLALLVKNAIEVGNEIAKSADKIGIGVEALQAYRFAADQAAAVSAGTFDMAMQRFSRRVGEAAQGSGELKDTLLQYGIAVRDTSGAMRPLEDILADYADVVANAESEQEQLRMAFKAFDSEGAVLVNMLKLGSAGIRELLDEARRLGAVMDESVVRQAEEARKQFALLAMVFKTQLNEAIIQLTPSLVALSQEIIKALPEIRSFIDLFLSPEGQSTDSLIRNLERVNEEIADIESTVSQILRFPNDVISGMMGLDSATDERLKRLKQTRAEIEAALTARLATPDDPMMPRKPAPAPPAPPTADAALVAQAEAALERVAARARDGMRALQRARLQASEDEIALVRFELQQQLDKIDTWARSEAEAQQARIMAHETAAITIAKIEEERNRKTREENEKTRQHFEVGWNRTTGSLDRLFDDLFDRQREGWEILRDIALSVLKDVAQAAAKTAMVQANIKGADKASSFGQLALVGIGALFGFAGGGDPPMGRPSIVGERGPEIFVPKAAGTVAPIAAGGSVVMNTTVVVQGGQVGASGVDAGTAAALQRQIHMMMRNAFAAEVMHHRRPGGLIGPGSSFNPGSL